MMTIDGHPNTIMRNYLSFLLASFFLPGFILAESIDLKSSSGAVISGEIEPGQRPNTIHITRSDGRLFKNVPILSLSVDSQKKVAEALALQKKQMANADITKTSRLDISFQRQKSAKNNNYGDIDDRIVNIQPQVTLDSGEREKTYQDIKGEVIIVGKEAVSKDRWVILNKQKFKFAKVEPDQRISWEGSEFECRYDPDYAGYDYEGYVVILFNKAGEVGMVKGSNSHWESVLPALMKARTNTGYDKDFANRLDLRTTWGLPGTR